MTVCNKNWLSLVPLVGNVTIWYRICKYIEGTQTIQEWQKAHCACKSTLHHDLIIGTKTSQQNSILLKISLNATCDLTYHFAYFLLYSFHILRPYFRQIGLDIAICSVCLLVLIVNLEIPLLQHFLSVDIRYDERDFTHLALDEPLLDLSQHGVQEGCDLLVRGRENEQTKVLGGLKRLRRIYPSLIEYTIDSIDCKSDSQREVRYI